MAGRSRFNAAAMPLVSRHDDALERTCHRASQRPSPLRGHSAMITLMAPSFTVSFRRPASPSYREAVRLAKQAHAYVEALESAGLTHHASFGATPEQWGLLAELWGLVRSWRASRLTVDGRPVLRSD